MSFRIKGNGCNHRSDEPCTRCWYEFHRKVPQTPLVTSFPDEFFMEHAFDPWDRVTPVSSREGLRELCESKGVTSHYLRDSSVWPSGERKWF